MADINSIFNSLKIKQLYSKVVDLVFAVILIFITITMIIGVARLFFHLGDLFKESGITGSYLYIFADVLTLYILIELSRSLVDYFSTHKLPLTPIIDAGIVFVLRHIMIDLFNHKLDTENIYALSALMIALAIIRVTTSMSFRKEHISLRPDTDTNTPVKTSE